MSVPYITLFTAVSKLLGDDQLATDFIKPKTASYKLHVAHRILLDVCISVHDLPIIDELKAMFLDGSTTVSTIALVPLIKAKYEANKSISNTLMLERSIIIDLHNDINLVKSIGRNQLLIQLTRAALLHTNEDVLLYVNGW